MSDADESDLFFQETEGLELIVTLNYPKSRIELEWTDTATNIPAAVVFISCKNANELRWELRPSGRWFFSSHQLASIRTRLNSFRKMLPTSARLIEAGVIPLPEDGATSNPPKWRFIDIPDRRAPWRWLEAQILHMAEVIGSQFGSEAAFLDPAFDREVRRLARKVEKEEIERAQREKLKADLEKKRAAKLQRAAARPERAEPAKPDRVLDDAIRAPAPPVPVKIDLPPLQFQETLLPLPDLRPYFLIERSALWWISNQSDDLLALPYCKIKHLEYQIRTALRVIGPMRGRALLSDEVGLGKTIEAGLVIKEYLTRGMIKRFLVLTVPSLVDQWEEELNDKFGLSAVTTNQSIFRADPTAFWQQTNSIVASLHTLKQPAHLAVARQTNWDMLVIDEAHYLRNQESQAWQAVNALPRQFLLLLTATPVQNSLEELYNLVTLLQPGQLPSPKEFRARFIDAKRPHQPRQPDELRRLISQVMIRNTRANAGLNLPPRRAETVLFEPEADEREFWQAWDAQLRHELSALNSSQASLWGRLLLQTAGSSPFAWREALKSFPNTTAAAAWRQQAPLEKSWVKKCDLLAPLTQAEGGVVIFTQFLQTQAALAERLQAARLPVWVINGQTPAAQRQPITEEFRRQSGALLLTHSGTEGRNLQFCHRLVNFDLPWNPMEIEQRIGRLHRIGQQHPVRIFNLVQAGTLQEHLLEILQEKLNLFELVVGETGLILGERFSSDEFAEEIFRRWRESDGRVAESIQALGDELAAAHAAYTQIKQLDETLFAKDYESL